MENLVLFTFLTPAGKVVMFFFPTFIYTFGGPGPQNIFPCDQFFNLAFVIADTHVQFFLYGECNLRVKRDMCLVATK